MLRDNERWVPGLEGKYAADVDGNIISYIRKRIVMVGGVLYDRKRGYKTYRIFTYKVSGKSKLEYFHRCIAKAFLDNPENKPYVNHIDGNKLNNRLSNLEWATPTENAQHAWDTGLMQGVLDFHSNYDAFVRADLHREKVIDKYLQTGFCEDGITNFTIENYLMSYDFKRNHIPPEFEGTSIKNGSYLNEWYFRFAVMSLLENSSYTLTEISSKVKLDLTMVSRIKNKIRWQDSWAVYNKYKNNTWYNPLI